MSTNVELTDEELSELKAFTKEANPEAAIRMAMFEYLRLARRLQLKKLSGQVTMEDNWKQLEDNKVNHLNVRSDHGVD